MLVSEIKKWAANKGYSVKTIKNVGYEWKKENSETKNFESDLEELAKKIYNDMTNNEQIGRAHV